MPLASTAGAAAAFLATVWGFRHYFDLGVYRGAVHHWLIGGGDLYAFRYRGSDFGFTYPPFAALVMSPLAAMSWPVAVVAATVANVGAVVLLLRWLLVPILRRQAWSVWVGCALVFCALLVFEPVRATLRLGQVNLLLLVLVCFDQRVLRGGRWAGVGIGVAAAVKLVPAVFIGYLVVSRQYRAAVTASGTAVAVTLFAGAVAPGSSHAFWTQALWDTDRVGQLAAVSNQSLRGLVARLDLGGVWWLVAAAVVVAIWFVRVRRAAAVGDHGTALALTGVVGCLISPVTWIHHLVWLLPALFVLLAAALTPPRRGPRRLRAGVVVLAYLVLGTKLTWMLCSGAPGWVGAVGSNLYVWICLGLLALTPIRPVTDEARSPSGTIPQELQRV